MKKLTDMPCPPQEFETDVYSRLTDQDLRYSEMPPCERKFINGLVRYFRPKNILELGVARGGGSIVLLNAIEDMPQSRLYSIDVAEKHWSDRTCCVGYSALRKYPDSKQWSLFTGKDPVDVIEGFGVKFDFLVLDTEHLHPVETLNFLAAFPYLSDNALVVIQDIGLYAHDMTASSPYYNSLHNFPKIRLAGKLLFDNVCGEKMTLDPGEYQNEWADAVLSNIGAIQLEPASRKFIDNAFYSLEFPWALAPSQTKRVFAFCRRHYSNRQMQIMKRAFLVNQSLVAGTFRAYGNFRSEIAASFDRVIFYGAGNYLAALLPRLYFFCDEAWDVNAERMEMPLLAKYNIPLKSPDYSGAYDKETTGVVITMDNIRNAKAVAEVKDRFLANGFKNVLHITDLFHL